jgi:prephenate dehydratase/prephenate dehydrogenase
MKTIATLGPQGSHAWQAARQYDPHAEIKLFPLIPAAVDILKKGGVDFAIIPVLNTREGEIKEFFRVMKNMGRIRWIDNIVLPIKLSLGTLDADHPLAMLIGRASELRQCEEYIATHFPNIALLTVQDPQQSIEDIFLKKHADRGVIGTEETLRAAGLVVRERELAPYNRTRFAVLSRQGAAATGYDATALVTAPLKDRVGLLYDILGEFSRRGVNLLDMRSESDIKTQRLQIYIEAEGHSKDKHFRLALDRIENHVIQERGAIRLLGSFPRVDMRTKHIQSFGFIGSGEMSQWFADRLNSEGYRTLITGRSSKLKPEEMISQVEVVILCVPISVTVSTIEKYGPLLKNGQALILLAGEAENCLQAAMANTDSGVEVMFVHNLWGPKVANMRDKNVAVVRTNRSGTLCSEFESFLYKHGAEIIEDSATQHDMLIGFSQKLPSLISVALAMTLADNRIDCGEIDSHSTLTSLYGVLAMARLHTQNPRTYAEIIATMGDGRKIVNDFAKNIAAVMGLAEQQDIDALCSIIDSNRQYLSADFLAARMQQALAVDEALMKIHDSYSESD